MRQPAVLLGAVWLVAGCASLPTLAPAPEAVSTSGRFAVTARLAEQTDSTSGRFTLRRAGAEVVLDLATPLGTTLARVEQNASGARLTAPRADGTLASWTGPDAESLLREVFNWSLPLAGMADWMAGRPRPPREGPVAGTTDGPDRFEQDGWTVQISDRFAPGGAPRLLVMTRPPAADAPGITLRLVLDEPAR
jgi:outer membrane lipoprotein LolB